MSEYAMTFGGATTQQDRLWAVVAQLSPFVSTFIGPLIVLLLFQDKSRFVRFHALQALALQAALWLAGLAVALLSWLTCGAGSVVYILLFPLALLPLYGAWLAWTGEWRGYPLLEDLGRA